MLIAYIYIHTHILKKTYSNSEGTYMNPRTLAQTQNPRPQTLNLSPKPTLLSGVDLAESFQESYAQLFCKRRQGFRVLGWGVGV